MKIPLSQRLAVCCTLVKQGDIVADIGCDHGYLGIHLLHEGIAQAVIATDLNRKPLEAARRNALKFGTLDRMRFYISDGVRSIPRDFTVLVCAGMGADTMISILENGSWLRCDRYRLILQCQSRTPFLRQYLSENGWQIRDEIPVRDGKFIYTVMEVIYAPGSPLTPGQCYLPPALQNHPGALLDGYRERILFGLKSAVLGKGEQADPLQKSAYEELCKEASHGEGS